DRARHGQKGPHAHRPRRAGTGLDRHHPAAQPATQRRGAPIGHIGGTGGGDVVSANLSAPMSERLAVAPLLPVAAAVTGGIVLDHVAPVSPSVSLLVAAAGLIVWLRAMMRPATSVPVT